MGYSWAVALGGAVVVAALALGGAVVVAALALGGAVVVAALCYEAHLLMGIEGA